MKMFSGHHIYMSAQRFRAAAVTAFVSAGSVTYLYVGDVGDGYRSDPVVRFIGGGGKGAKARARISDGKLVHLELLDGGQGYWEAPSVMIGGS